MGTETRVVAESEVQEYIQERVSGSLFTSISLYGIPAPWMVFQ